MKQPTRKRTTIRRPKAGRPQGTGTPTVAAPKTTETARLTRFEFYAPDARLVCLAGSFNQWNPTVTPMTRRPDGNWVKELPLAPGHHEYQFVLDGKWTPDLKAKDAIPNSFGGFNSVVEVLR